MQKIVIGKIQLILFLKVYKVINAFCIQNYILILNYLYFYMIDQLNNRQISYSNDYLNYIH
jgi:hypothetical protein